MFRQAVSGLNTIVVICEGVARLFWVLQEDSIGRLDRYIVIEVVKRRQEEANRPLISFYSIRQESAKPTLMSLCLFVY